MADHLVVDASRQPAQIRCFHCGGAQDLALPMRVSKLVILEATWRQQHRRCKASDGPRGANSRNGLDNAPCP